MIASPGELIASIPALMGFVPEDSLVLAAMADGQLVTMLRVDLAFAGRAVDQMVGPMVANDVDGVHVVIVGFPPADFDVPGLEQRLLSEGIKVHGAFVVPAVAEGQAWMDLRGDGSGVVGSPRDTELAAAAAYSGRPLRGSRADLHAELDVDAEKAARVGLLISQAPGDFDVQPGMSDLDLAGVAVALQDGAFRDEAYRMAVDEPSPVWEEVARSLPSPWRAAALGVVAFAAYVRGDGPRAGLALEAALQADPDNKMAALMDKALQSGIPPARVRAILAV